MLPCIGSYLLCKTMSLQVISMGSFLIEVTEEVLGIGEVVLNLHEDGVGAEILMMSLVVIRIEEVVEILKPATAGLEQKKAAVGMIG